MILKFCCRLEVVVVAPGEVSFAPGAGPRVRV